VFGCEAVGDAYYHGAFGWGVVFCDCGGPAGVLRCFADCEASAVEVDEDGVAFPPSGADLGRESNGLEGFVCFGGVEEEFDKAGGF
jgi:hypothetical protein